MNIDVIRNSSDCAANAATRNRTLSRKSASSAGFAPNGIISVDEWLGIAFSFVFVCVLT